MTPNKPTDETLEEGDYSDNNSPAPTPSEMDAANDSSTDMSHLDEFVNGLTEEEKAYVVQCIEGKHDESAKEPSVTMDDFEKAKEI